MSLKYKYTRLCPDARDEVSPPATKFAGALGVEKWSVPNSSPLRGGTYVAVTEVRDPEPNVNGVMLYSPA